MTPRFVERIIMSMNTSTVHVLADVQLINGRLEGVPVDRFITSTLASAGAPIPQSVEEPRCSTPARVHVSVQRGLRVPATVWPSTKC